MGCVLLLVLPKWRKRLGVRSSLEDVQLNMKHPNYFLEVLISLHVNDKLHDSFKAEFSSWQDHRVV